MYYKLHFNVVERLKYYMKLRNMNAYQLTQKTQLSENTIPNLLKKKNGLPRLDTLLDILQGLNVSVSEFFGETERDTLEPDEERLLNNYNELDEERKRALLLLSSKDKNEKK